MIKERTTVAAIVVVLGLMAGSALGGWTYKGSNPGNWYDTNAWYDGTVYSTWDDLHGGAQTDFTANSVVTLNSKPGSNWVKAVPLLIDANSTLYILSGGGILMDGNASTPQPDIYCSKYGTNGTLIVDGGFLDIRTVILGGKGNASGIACVATFKGTSSIKCNLDVGAGDGTVAGRRPAIVELNGSQMTIVGRYSNTFYEKSTLKIVLDANGNTPWRNRANLTFKAGSILDISGVLPTVTTTYDIMSANLVLANNYLITDGGLAFAATMDTDLSDGIGWTKAIVGNHLLNQEEILQATYHIPEPMTLALLGLGAVGVLVRRRVR